MAVAITPQQIQTAHTVITNVGEVAEAIRKILTVLIENSVAGVTLDSTMVTNLNTAYQNQKSNLQTLVTTLP